MAVALLGIKETAPGERRVALTPETARKLGALGITVWYEAGAGLAAGFTDAAYDDAGARAFDAGRWAEIDILLCVQAPPAASSVPLMFHCHILEHEDAGMMGQFVTT